MGKENYDEEGWTTGECCFFSFQPVIKLNYDLIYTSLGLINFAVEFGLARFDYGFMVSRLRSCILNKKKSNICEFSK